jgi:hypothetical protein
MSPSSAVLLRVCPLLVEVMQREGNLTSDRRLKIGQDSGARYISAQCSEALFLRNVEMNGFYNSRVVS